MLYLAIFMISAVAGIGYLGLYQRRQRRHLESVDGFRSSLEKISTHEIAIPAQRIERSSISTRPGGPRRPEPLDPARREAARRRLERRRATRA